MKEARGAFEKAYAEYPHPSILLNLGIVKLRTGDYVGSEIDLTRFLVNDGGATPEELASGRAALEEARAHLGTMRLHVTPSNAHASLDGQTIALVQGGTTEIRTTTGLHDVKISADDFEPDEEHVMVVRDKVAERTILLTPHSGIVAAPIGGTDTSTPPVRAVVGWGLVGVAGAATLGGVLCGVRAISLADDYNTRRPQDPSDKSAGIAFRTTADILFATAIVGAGVGTYLLLTTPKATTSISAGPASVRFRMTF